MKNRLAFSVSAAALCAVAIAPLAVRASTLAGAPDAYLDYVEATGSQYIDTGVEAETSLKARFDCVLSSETQNDSCFLDAKHGSNLRFMMIHSYNKKYYFAIGNGNDAKRAGSDVLPFDERIEIVSDVTDGSAIQLYFYGTPQISAANQAKSASSMPSTVAITTSDMNGLTLYLFAGNFDGEAGYYGKGKLYELKIFKKDATTGGLTLLRHYLPCLKNGRAALYDKANGILYFSDGSDDFVAGPEIVRPAAMVEWVEASGATSSSVAQQYVDTKVWGKLGLKSEVDVTLLENSGDHAILASRGVGNSTDFRLYMAYHYSGYFCYGDGALRQPKTVKPVSGTRYLIASDLSAAAQSVTVNGTELYQDTFTGASYFATSNTLALLANNHNGAYVKNPTHSRLWSARIWDGDELLRDFAPCVATNGAAGLYDAVSERVFFPETTPFDLDTQVGAVTNVLVEVAAPKTRLEYVDSDGEADYVDLGLAGKDGLEMDAVMEWLTVPSDGAFAGARNNSQTNNRNTLGVRFFPYHHWSGHRLGYSAELAGAYGDGDTALVAETGVKYKISSRLDDGDQRFSVASGDNGVWTAVGSNATAYTGPVDTELPLYLFAINYNGEGPKYFGHARVNSLKFSVKDASGAYAAARDLVPVRDPLTGGVALWDKVSETYWRNAGRYRLSGGGTERPLEAPFVMVVR